MSRRADELVRLVAERDLELLIVGDLVRPGDSGPDAIANIRWLTGFSGTSGLALIGPDDRLFLTDFRYAERAERQVDSGFDRASDATRLLPAAASRLHGRVGFDDTNTSVKSLESLRRDAPQGVELVPAGGLVEALRRVKDDEEVDAMAEATRISDETYEWLCEQGFAGRTETEVALAAEVRMRELGAEGPGFPPIVAAGDNGATPHHEASDRKIAKGESLLIDMSAKVRGYCSDGTRTFSIGEPDEAFRDVYELVRVAQQAGLDAVKSGVDGKDADCAARSVINEGGHGDRFGHGLGHGVGLEIHEAPRLGKSSEDTLETGNAVTVEPGVYLPGSFGVRIEDLVIVTDDGNRNLSTFTRELREVD